MSEDRRRRVRGSDVARMAGVSVATVSYVLNGTGAGSISHATQKRVREAADRLGYRPDPAARSLRTGRSDVVLALLPDLEFSAAFQRSLHELAVALKPMGLSLMVHPTTLDSAAMRDLWRAVTPVCVFAFTALHPQDVAAMHAAGIQVAVACSDRDDRQPWELNHDGGKHVGFAQAEHLRATGHTRVGLALPAAPAAQALSVGRRAGIVEVFAEDQMSVRELPWDVHAAAPALSNWLEEEPEMTAIAAWNDEMGAQLMAAAAGLGIAVPGQLAVIGAYDSRLATLVQPPLTSVRVDLEARMQTIALAIRAVLQGESLPTAVLGGQAVAVVVRGSA